MIRTKLILWNSLILALVLASIGLAIYLSTQANIYRAVDEDMTRRSAFLDKMFADSHGRLGGPPPDGGPPGPPHPHDEPPFDDHDRDHHHDGDSHPGPPPNPSQFIDEISKIRKLDPIEADRLKFAEALSRPRVFRRDRGRADHTDQQPYDDQALKLALAGQTSFKNITLDGHSVRVLSLPLRYDRHIEAAAQFASSLDEIDLVVARLGTILLASLPVVLLITAVIGSWLTSRALRPVKQIADAAEGIGAGSLSERLPINGNDEFAYLSEKFNGMIGRLDSSFAKLNEALEAQRRFIADASHELKTPLTTIKGRAGMAMMGVQTPERYGEHFRAINRAADRMTAIVQDLLFLARADEKKLRVKFECVDASQLLNDAVTAVADPRKTEIGLPPASNVRLWVDISLMARAIQNLLTNALRHTPPGKSVSIELASQTDQIVISIVDQGEGISPDHLPFLFDRFYRVDAARDRAAGGTGLGLSIVKSIVEAHGGTIKIESELGKGTKVVIALPASREGCLEVDG